MPSLQATQSTQHQLPPGPTGLPVLGNIPQYRRDPLGFMTGLQRSYGRVATIRFAGIRIVAFFRPEAVRYFLVEQARNFTSGEFNGELRTLLGDGLLTTDGDFHRRQRRLVQPAFHKRRVDGYAAIMVQHTEDWLADQQDGAVVDLATEMQRLTLRIVAKALFNVDLRHESAGLGRSFTDVIEHPVGEPFSLSSIPLDLPFTPYGKNRRAARVLDEFVYGLIAERRKSGADTGDVLSMLLAARDDEKVNEKVNENAGLTDREVRDQTMTLFAAGHETTANALAWTFYLLSQHPAALETLQAELRAVLGDRVPSVDDIPALPYLDQVVKESMRLYPPAWTLGRTATDGFSLEGYSFPPRTVVMFSQWVMHRLPDLWPNPQAFLPERFAPEAERAIPPYAYFPFGGGPRMCIGMPFANLEVRLLLATILQRFAPRVVRGYPVVPLPRVTLRPRYGLGVTLEPAGVQGHRSPAGVSRGVPLETRHPLSPQGEGAKG